MKERAENFARWVADFQADHAPAWPHHAQHFTKALANIGQVARGKGGTAAIDTVVRQVDMLRVAQPQLDLVLQAQARNFGASDFKHLWRNIQTYHARSWPRTPDHRD